MPNDEKAHPATGGVQNKVVQTYAEDVAKVIEGERGGGLIKKIIREDEEKEEAKKKTSPEADKNKLFVILGVLLIVATLVTLYFFVFAKNVATVPVDAQFTPLIFLDQSTNIEVKGLTKEKIAQAVESEVNATKVKQGGVQGIYLTEDNVAISLRRFISLLKGDFFPDINFVNDNFLLGVVNNQAEPVSSAGKDLFILLKMRSVPDIFDSMRAWEEKMFLDLQGFFGVEISSDTRYLLTKSFEDGIVENKNARILYDINRKIVMMYIFADNNSVIITDSALAAREIILRLASSQIKK